MLKQLLATTAIVAIATSAYAAGTTDQAAKGATMKVDASAGHYVSQVDTSDVLATNLIGQKVYSGTPANAMPQATNGAQAQNGTADQMKKNGQANPPQTAQAQNDNQEIGGINNLVVAQDGSIDAVVIGVGGFLGIGEKNVAVPFKSLQWSTDASGKPMIFLASTKEQLKSAPNFDVSMLQKDQTAMPNNRTALNPPPAGANPPAPGMAGHDVATNAPNANPNANVDANGAAVDATKISANDLSGAALYDADNQNVGSVDDVIVNKDGTIDAVVVDVGGFLGIGQKPVAIAFGDLKIVKDKDGKLVAYTTFTKDQLDNAPKYDKNAYKDQRDQMLLRTQS